LKAPLQISNRLVNKNPTSILEQEFAPKKEQFLNRMNCPHALATILGRNILERNEMLTEAPVLLCSDPRLLSKAMTTTQSMTKTSSSTKNWPLSKH
jgi:hypothetical protein